MSIYFDFKTINELTRENSSNQERIFTLDELAQYDGQNGNRAYVAIEDIVYDVSDLPDWQRGANYNIVAGRDLTEKFISCQEMIKILNNAPRIGVLRERTNVDYDMEYNRAVGKSSTTTGAGTNTSNFTPDDWVRYITPIINYAMTQTNQGSTMNNNMYQRVAIMGVLVGLGKTPREAIDQLQDWEDTGKLTLLKSTGMGTGTQGTMTGGAGTGSGGTGMIGGFGTTGGTTGGMGTSTGAGTGSGGTGMIGGFGTTGGTTGGMGTGMGAGTGLGGTGMTGGFGTTGGTTGGMGTSTGAGTGLGGTGMTGGFGTTGGTTGGTGSTRGESENNNRLIFD